MGLVHDTKNDAVVVGVLRRELGPKALELSIGGTALSDDAVVPASIVVLWTMCETICIRWESVSRTRSTMTRTLGPELSADWTVWSYFEKKAWLMLPPRVGVISAHAKAI